MSERKRVRHSARLSFMRYLFNDRQIHVPSNLHHFYRSLLINPKFIDSFFLNPKRERLIITIKDTHIALHRAAFLQWRHIAIASNALHAILMLANLREIQVDFCASRMSREFVEMCVSFCRALKANNSLQFINLNIRGWEQTPESRMVCQIFIDLLPQKISHLKMSLNNASILLGRMGEIGEITIWDSVVPKSVMDNKESYDQLLTFKLNTKRLKFDSKNTISLFDLPAIDSLKKKSNDEKRILKEISIPLDFLVFDEDHFDLWLRKYGKKFDKSFEQLSRFDKDLKLELVANAGDNYSVDDFEELDLLIDCSKDCLKHIIDTAFMYKLDIQFFHLSFEVLGTKSLKKNFNKWLHTLGTYKTGDQQMAKNFKYKKTIITIEFKFYFERYHKQMDYCLGKD